MKINIQTTTKDIAMAKGLFYTILMLGGFYYHPVAGIALLAGFVFAYEVLSEKELESKTFGKVYFYSFSLIAISFGLLAWLVVISK